MDSTLGTLWKNSRTSANTKEINDAPPKIKPDLDDILVIAPPDSGIDRLQRPG
jgi:hypothetical protein